MPLSPDDFRALLRRPDLSDEHVEDFYVSMQWLAEALIDDYLLTQHRTRTVIGGLVDEARLAIREPMMFVMRVLRTRCQLQPVPPTQNLFDMPQRGERKSPPGNRTGGSLM
jgi:hypothetical protein